MVVGLQRIVFLLCLFSLLATSNSIVPKLHETVPAAIPVSDVAVVDVSKELSTETAMRFPENITDYYRGTWSLSPNTTLDPVSFKNTEGSVVFHLVASKKHNAEIQTIQAEIVIRDGFTPTEHDIQAQLEGLYHPASGSVVLWTFLGDSLVPVQSFSFAPLNISAEEAKIDTTKQIPIIQTRSGFGTISYCFFSVRLQLDPMRVPELGEEVDKTDDINSIRANGLVGSDSCGVHLRLDTTAMNSEVYFLKAMHYTLMVSMISFIQMSLLVKQMEYSATQANAAKVSLLTVGEQGMIDCYMSLLHLFTGVFVESLLTAFAATSFFKFIVFSLFEMRFLLVIWQARHPQLFHEGLDRIRREYRSLYYRFYGFFSLGIALFWLLQSNLNLLVMLLYSFWLPQIIHNIQHAHRKPLLPSYIIGISLTRLCVPMYIYLCPKNWLRSPQDPAFALALSAFVLAQALTLILQHHLGPRFFLPRKWIPRAYDYYRPIPTEMHEINPQSGQFEIDCVICMSTVNISARNAVVTPCDHIFHVDCLTQWIQIKMECPTCRRAIPDLVD